MEVHSYLQYHCRLSPLVELLLDPPDTAPTSYRQHHITPYQSHRDKTLPEQYRSRIGVIDLLLCFLMLHKGNPLQSPQIKQAWKHFDILGLLLSITGFTILVYGIAQAGALGWGNATMITFILVGLVLLAVFVVLELQVSDPMLDLRLFMNGTFTLSNSLLWMVTSVFFGSLFLLPLFFEKVQGNTTLTAGTFLIDQGLALGVGITIAGVLYNRMGPRNLTVFGLLLLIGGTYGLTQIDVHSTGAALQIWLIMRGLGAGFVYQPIQTLALSVVSSKGMAKGSSLVNVMRQVATAAAVASLTAYLTGQTTAHGVGPQATTTGIIGTFWIILILSALCIPLALILGDDPALKAQKQAQVPGATVKTTGIPDIIWTLTANGEEVMGPEILLWHHPAVIHIAQGRATVKAVWAGPNPVTEQTRHLHYGMFMFLEFRNTVV